MPIDTFVFTGIAGLQKAERLNHLRRFLLTEYFPELRADHERFQAQLDALIPIVELVPLTEGEIEGELGDVYDTYKERFRKFRTEVERIISASAPPKCLFVHTHLTNFISGHFRSWLAVAQLDHLFKGLEIKLIINLIDNIYTCRHMIQHVHYTKFPLTLDHIITWRDIELMASEMLVGQNSAAKRDFDTSRIIFEKSKVVAVNHCLQTVADLLFKPSKYQVYTAYAISKIRDIEYLISECGDIPIADFANDASLLANLSNLPLAREQRDERIEQLRKLISGLASEFPGQRLSWSRSDLFEQNRSFREFCKEHFVAYDPGTIDEIPLLRKAKNSTEAAIVISSSDQWPQICPETKRLAKTDVLAMPDGINPIPVAEISELGVPIVSDRASAATSIGRQVRSRDLRLIGQSDAVIAYRPTIGGRWSGGVQAEIEHVKTVGRKPFFIIKGKHDGTLDEGSELHWELGRHYGEWDLSIENERKDTFEHAKSEIVKRIENFRRVSQA